MDKINIGIIGLGVVGTGIIKVLEKNKNEITNKFGKSIVVKAAADLDLERKRDIDLSHIHLTKNAEEIINNPDIDIIAEAIGGINPAKEFILKAFKNKKHVVSPNKELIAKYMPELVKSATDNGVNFLFEGAVGGGIPIINPIRTTLSGNKITDIFGIINGTTNYILTKMKDEKADFSRVLREAQKLGFAEQDPTSDVDGFDSVYKLSILSSLAFQSYVSPQKIYRKGIRTITIQDIEYARTLGYTVKLVASARNHEGAIETMVYPTLVPDKHPLASVSNAMNAIYVCGNAVGETMFYGQGAGEMPTGSALVGDMIEIAFHSKNCRNSDLINSVRENSIIKEPGEIVSEFYIRFSVQDKPGVLSGISGALGNHNVSIRSALQLDTCMEEATLVIITHSVYYRELQAALKDIEKLSNKFEIGNVIRVGLT